MWYDYIPFYNDLHDIVFQLGPALPLWLLLMLGITILLFKQFIEYLEGKFPLIKDYYSSLDKFDDIKEGFADYFCSLGPNQVKWVHAEEKYCRDFFGYKTMPTETFRKYDERF